MSRGQLARTPKNFPRMQNRAHKRHERAAAVAALPDVLASLRRMARIDWTPVRQMLNQLAVAVAAFRKELAARQHPGLRIDLTPKRDDSNDA
ncbi:hypothetical protein [Nocardia abscessus]|uniref:hypothetical protein n=1 Tax=Nocardia abscessus TaxID=120957 RepID=UPI0024577818|nr:hypothetical protein [Nocardia abscessus]